MRTALAIAIAGALGALARWGVGSWFGQRFPSFAWGTLVVNVSGSFVLGLLFALLIERAAGSPTTRSTILISLVSNGRPQRRNRPNKASAMTPAGSGPVQRAK